MISDLNTHPIEKADAGARLALKPVPGSGSGVDGGWWPRSTDPRTEFPALISALADHGVPVRRISYNLDAWDHGERRVVVDGVLVRLEGFHSTPADTVTAIGPDRTRTRILVLPHDTDRDTASAALRTAGDPSSSATAAAILKPPKG